MTRDELVLLIERALAGDKRIQYVRELPGKAMGDVLGVQAMTGERFLVTIR